MVAINLSAFGGLSKKLAPRLLPESMGVEVKNVDFSHGSLRPLKGYGSTSVTFNLGGVDGGTRTVYKTGSDRWLEFSRDVDVIESPVAEDQYERIYLTNNSVSYPQITSGQSLNNIYKLGIPRPPTPSTSLSPSSSANTESETPISRAYLATYVTAYGEEGPSSDVEAADIIDVYTDQTVSITVGSATGTRNYAYIRIYRTDEDGVFRFLHQGSSSGFTINDTVPDTDLGEEVPSRDWIGPPDEMLGLVTIPNGISAGFVGQTLCLSEAYLPHAWPEEYQLTTKYPIVGLAPLDTGLLVLTKGKPSIVQGADPAGMVMTELDIAQSCVSKRSIVDMGNSVLYASPDGLVRVSSSGSSVVTESLFTKDQWQADYSPSTIRAYRWEDRYVAFHDYEGSNPSGFIFDSRGGQNSLTHIATTGIAGFNDLEDDTLYIVDANGSLKEFATGSAYASYDWESKHFFTQRPINLGVVQVSFGTDLGGGSTTIVLYGGEGEPDTTVHTETVSGTKDTFTFRLPSGTKYNVFKAKLSGKREINSITFAESPQELR
jgi:hypothetical protein